MIRLLAEHDLQAWKDIRLESLQCNPESFLESPEEFLQKSDEQILQQLSRNHIFGYFDAKGRIQSTIGFMVDAPKRLQHKGVLWAVYTRAEQRRTGISTQLLHEVVAHARTQNVTQIHLTVWAENVAAIAYYKKHGFSIYGTEHGAICIDGRSIDDHLMVKMLVKPDA
ncbi:MAG: N-acetyltransferase family protein [Rickettsiales bacterium]